MKKIVLIISYLLNIIMIISCNNNHPQLTTLNYYGYLDTISYITLETKDQESIIKIKADIENIFQTIETLFGTNNSVTTKINELAGKKDENQMFYPTTVNDTYLTLIQKGKNLSDGKTFDIMIGSLTKLWNISEQAEYCLYDYSCQIPSNTQIIEAVASIDASSLVIEDNKVYLTNSKASLDFGAIAKGYASDLIKAYLIKQKINFFVINLGGNIYLNGESATYKKQNKTLFISLENPLNSSQTILDIYVTNTSVVTSASTHRYIEVDGIKYSHIINPLTGYPVDNDLLSVTIIGDEGVMCDALSTKCFVMGLNDAVNYLKTTSYQAIFVTKNKQIYIVGNINIKLTNQEFQII